MGYARRTLIAALSVAALAGPAAGQTELTRYQREVMRLEATPLGALPRIALPMPASRDRHYWVARLQAAHRGLNGGAGLQTVAGGLDLQWRDGSTVGLTAGYQQRDCTLLGPDCGGHLLFGTRARFNVITGGSRIGERIGDYSATSTLGTEVGFGYAPDALPGAPACAIDVGVPISLAMMQTVRVATYVAPGVVWDAKCGGEATGRASYFTAGGIGIQQLAHPSLDVYVGVQKIYRRASGYQLGLSVTWTRLPPRRVTRAR
ncbi:hypothetical protein BH23GEM9_BH23GEM9_09270 [soil metagenome]